MGAAAKVGTGDTAWERSGAAYSALTRPVRMA
jgi:hypothetical protein